MKFNSDITARGFFPADFSDEVIKNEPMFFNSSLQYAYKHSGPITRAFIDRLPKDWVECNPVLDSRVHMLMPGWYPCIPGYHHDDVPRSTSTGQPNYTDPEYHSEHLMGLVNGDICPTEFALGELEVSDPDINTTIYKTWHTEVQHLIDTNQVHRLNAKSGILIQFDWESFHTGTAAVQSGWRWFVRLSRNTDRQNRITNEIRRQVQVYMENPVEGW